MTVFSAIKGLKFHNLTKEEQQEYERSAEIAEQDYRKQMAVKHAQQQANHAQQQLREAQKQVDGLKKEIEFLKTQRNP